MSSEASVSAGDNRRSQLYTSSHRPADSGKPPISIQPGSHLDPGAYVRGKYPITIGQNVLIHPRAHLLSIHSPLAIGDGCIISERCILGGPLPASSTASQTDTTDETISDESPNLRATIIEDLVHLHPNVTINHGSIVAAACVLESNVLVNADIPIGAHSKVCSNIIVSKPVPDWTVVWGTTTDLKHRNRAVSSTFVGREPHEAVEKERIRAMERERDGTMTVLRTAASKTLMSKNKR